MSLSHNTLELSQPKKKKNHTTNNSQITNHKTQNTKITMEKKEWSYVGVFY